MDPKRRKMARSTQLRFGADSPTRSRGLSRSRINTASEIFGTMDGEGGLALGADLATLLSVLLITGSSLKNLRSSVSQTECEVNDHLGEQRALLLCVPSVRGAVICLLRKAAGGIGIRRTAALPRFIIGV